MTKIAGVVDFSLDMRSLDIDFLDETEALVRKAADAISKRRNVTFALNEVTRAAPGVLSQQLQSEFAEVARTLEVPHMPLASGASHDAAAFADAGVETAMLFIRNANGSHNPDEAMALEDFNMATRVLGHWVLARHT